MPVEPPDNLTISLDLAADAVTSAAEAVLQTMFFAAAAPGEPPEGWGRGVVGARVEFRGPVNGQFQLEIDGDCARELAGNALFEDDDQQVGQMLRELANMLCGNTLSRLAPTGLFDLAAPTLLKQGLAQRMPGTVETWMETESGFLRLAVRLHP